MAYYKMAVLCLKENTYITHHYPLKFPLCYYIDPDSKK